MLMFELVLAKQKSDNQHRKHSSLQNPNLPQPSQTNEIILMNAPFFHYPLRHILIA